jgi:hypothetical protein
MGLLSAFFRGDRALEACQVQDAAHVTKGARGPHVRKIQIAVATLDGALIDGGEISQSLYGSSTAAAVLAYKRARSIINLSYQRQADDIVGKMTITALDKDMLAAERPRSASGCPEPARSGAEAPVAQTRSITRVGLLSGVRETVRTPQFPAILSTLFQIVRIGNVPGRHSIALIDTVRRANDIASPFGLSVRMIAGFGFSWPRKVLESDETEMHGLRRAAEKAMPGFDKALRVILCPFRLRGSDDDDNKVNGRSFPGPSGMNRFVVINSSLLREDRATLLHEMIHCSDERLMFQAAHEQLDETDVFSTGGSRTKLNPVHAGFLREAFFAFKR